MSTFSPASPEASPLLRIVSPRPSPRLAFAVNVLLERLLGLQTELIRADAAAGNEAEETSPPALTLYYGPEPPPSGPWLPAHGLLAEEGVRTLSPVLAEAAGPPRLFSLPHACRHPAALLDFDPLAACFYLASEYDNVLQARFDRHGRYDDRQAAPYRFGLHRRPLLHEYAALLGDALRQHFPALRPQLPPAAVRYTLDLDQPWRYLHKPRWVQAAAFARRLLTGDTTGAREQWQAWRTGRDPYGVYPELMRQLPPGRTSIFFLAGGKHRYDSRFSTGNQAFQELIRRFQAEGFGTCLHPSYTTCRRPDRLRREKDWLANLLGRRITCARQHYLRYRLPETRRHLLDAGIREDYTTVSPYYAGFKHGLAVPFPFYDLGNEELTALMLQPTHLMDRGLLGYEGCSPAEALALALDVWAQVQRWGGSFTLLLHNDLWAGRYDWAGWPAGFLAPLLQALDGTGEADSGA